MIIYYPQLIYCLFIAFKKKTYHILKCFDPVIHLLTIFVPFFYQIVPIFRNRAYKKKSETEILQTTTKKGVPTDVEGEAQWFVCAGGSVVSVGDRAGRRGGRHRYTGMTDSIISALRLPIPCV